MSWGVGYFYYICPECGCKFKYAIDMIAAFADDFGKCPTCGHMGTYIRDGAIGPDDADYIEVEE